METPTKYYLYLLLYSTFIVSTVGLAQSDNPMNNQRWNIFDVNNIRTQFNNTGLLCDGNQQNMPLARPPAFEFPNGSGLSWGTSVAVVIGAPADQDSGAVGGGNEEDRDYLDASMDEGSAAFWDEEHFAPYAEFVGTGGAPLSSDSSSWTDWPQFYPNSQDTVWVNGQAGGYGWPGAGPKGTMLADQENFSVMYAWQGTDSYANPGGDISPRWLNTQVVQRGLAWSGSLYENFIVFVYEVRNIGTAPIVDMRMGVHLDLGFLPSFVTRNQYDADRHYYDPDLQLAYGWDDNSFEVSPFGNTLGAEDIPWGGAVILEMPGSDPTVDTYDAFHFWQYATTARGNGARKDWYYQYNLANFNDPHDSNDDGIDDDFDDNGVPDADDGGIGYYVGSGADGVQTIGSHPFTLNPGQTDTLIFAVAFGKNEDDLKNNAKRAKNLYESNWETVEAPPAPVLEAQPKDRSVRLVWSNNSEHDKGFEGYKIYKSIDGGNTWGQESFTDFSGGVHYVPLEQFDLANDHSGNYTTLPEYAWYDLGDDTGLPRQEVITAATDTFQYFEPGDTVNIYTDRDVLNGFEYIYYVAAYDSGNKIIGPLENTAAKQPAEENNTVKTVPAVPVTEQSLKDVKVVPNPYVVANSWETGRTKVIQFTNLPAQATVRIYNVAGEHIQTLRHNSTSGLAESVAVWDAMNYDNQLIAPGVYFYHVSSDIGETTGKFVVIH